MRVTILASGSGGNATLFSSGQSHVLVDAGVGPRVLLRLLREAGSVARPTAIVITHAHGDHVGQCEALARKYGIPIYLSEATARAVTVPAADVRTYSARASFAVGALTVHPLPLPHDAAQVALVLEDPTGGRAAVVTDLGEVPASLLEHVRTCDVLLLESNHDEATLRAGSYPEFLKKRILSARGHLSNEQTHEFLQQLSPRTHTVVLMHLSRTNNDPALAFEAARDALGERNVQLQVAAPRGVMKFDTSGCTNPTQTTISALVSSAVVPAGQTTLAALILAPNGQKTAAKPLRLVRGTFSAHR